MHGNKKLYTFENIIPNYAKHPNGDTYVFSNEKERDEAYEAFKTKALETYSQGCVKDFVFKGTLKVSDVKRLTRYTFLFAPDLKELE